MVLLIISYWTSFAQISRLQWIRKFGVLGTGVRENEINYAVQQGLKIIMMISMMIYIILIKIMMIIIVITIITSVSIIKCWGKLKSSILAKCTCV